MKSQIKNATELTQFIQNALPHIKDTGKARDLRKIKPDPISKGKGVIIWWGNPRIDEVTELRVTVNLGVSNVCHLDPPYAKDCEALLKSAYSLQNERITQEKVIDVPAESVGVDKVENNIAIQTT